VIRIRSHGSILKCDRNRYKRFHIKVFDFLAIAHLSFLYGVAYCVLCLVLYLHFGPYLAYCAKMQNQVIRFSYIAKGYMYFTLDSSVK